MQKKYKIGLTVVIFLVFLLIIVLVGKYFTSDNKKETIVKVDSIDNYNYTLDERDTKLMTDTFKSLKKVLNAKEINYEEYAKYLSELFIIDLFTIDNKVNKYDVPCLEYLLDDTKENFSLNISDTIYKYISDNTDKKRKQDLPVVKSIEVENIETIKYTYQDNQYEGYKVSLNWEYETDYGYDKKGNIKVINKDNKLYVVNYETSEVDHEESN